MSSAPWFDIARGEIGLKEIPGAGNNPRISEYIKVCGGDWIDDEIPWCGSFVGFCIRTAGLSLPSLPWRARSWLRWGVGISPEHIPTGAILVFGTGKNPPGAAILKSPGHVTFFHSKEGVVLNCLGGNQSDSVNVAPFSMTNLLGVRWPG